MKSDFLKAYGFAKAFVQTQYKPFTSEDLKAAYQKRNPNSKYNNWGRIMAGLADSKKVIHNDFVKAKCASARKRYIIQWITYQYSEHQRAKRELPDTKLKRETQTVLFK